MPNEYMTPEIGKVIPMLTQTCDDLTRQALVRGLTEKTQEWVEGDPELADVLLSGDKTLENCVRYVTEKAACVISKNINSMLNAELENLPKMKIQGKDAAMAGGAIDAEQVFKWAQEYYYTPDAKPTDFKKEAERKTAAAKAKAEADKKKADAAKRTGNGKKGAKANSAAVTAATTAAGAEKAVETSKTTVFTGETESGEQISMFGVPHTILGKSVEYATVGFEGTGAVTEFLQMCFQRRRHLTDAHFLRICYGFHFHIPP